MRALIGFDDTDTWDSDRGTGKLARGLEKVLPKGCTLWGVIRQQLLIDERIPYTSHNSAACVIVDSPDYSLRDQLISSAAEYIEKESFGGSDPGFCFAFLDGLNLTGLIEFGHLCNERVVTQREALEVAKKSRGIHLSGHGGDNGGIIGAAAAVGLTASGWCGRFIEFRNLRGFPEKVSVAELERSGIMVVSLDRDSLVPNPEDMVNTKNWLRPRLWGFRPVLPVLPSGKSQWEIMGEKNRGK